MRKKFLLGGLFAMVLATSTFAQEPEGSQKSNDGFPTWTFDIDASALDFYSPKLNDFQFFKRKMAIGPDINVTRQWSKVGLGLSANVLSPSITFLDRQDGSAAPVQPEVNDYLVMFGPGLTYFFQNQYLIKAKSPVAPFVFANTLVSVARNKDNQHQVKFGFGIPVGAGVYFKLADKVALNVKGGYQFGLTDYYEDNIFYSIGATLGIPKIGKKTAEPQAFVPVDTDGDGIPDVDDKCPDVAGLAQFDGCPDTDGDGIADNVDECPDVAGPQENNGCPWPDTDGDGVADHLDKCPNVAGLAQFDGCPDTDGDGIADNVDKCPNVAGPKENNGCPWPDTDGDGVPDHIDKCPNVAGPATNKGCPEIKEETKVKLQQLGSSVQFETGKSILKPASKKVLDQVVSILNQYPAYHVNVEGYTDNTGSDEINNKLSAERAKVCADYIISKGIDASRVSSAGFGSKNPIADNATAAGRAKNRRTEFKMTLD